MYIQDSFEGKQLMQGSLERSRIEESETAQLRSVEQRQDRKEFGEFFGLGWAAVISIVVFLAWWKR